MFGMTGRPYEGKKIRVSFTSVRAGQIIETKNAVLDNDVPLIPDRIWETKRYTRLDYGLHDEAANQLLKYQAAINTGQFRCATLEVFGNIAPKFLRQLIDNEPLAPGLYLEVPDVEVLYALDGLTAIPLRRSRFPVSLARTRDVELDKQLIRALARKRYEIFSGRILDASDVGDPRLRHAVRDGKIDPEAIADPDAFRLFERLLHEKRLALLRST
jgi:hypothetical protein